MQLSDYQYDMVSYVLQGLSLAVTMLGTWDHANVSVEPIHHSKQRVFIDKYRLTIHVQISPLTVTLFIVTPRLQ